MKTTPPFYYHIFLFAGLIFVFELWNFGIKQTSPSINFSSPIIWFSTSYIVSIFLTYCFGFYVFSNLLYRRKYLLYLISIPVSLLFFVCSRYLLEEVMIYNISGIHNYSTKSLNILYYITDNFLFGMPAIILSALYFLLWQFLTYQRHYQQLQLENQKAQFDMLRSQVGPHFLFNTLNSFYSDWIEKDEKTASDLLILTNLLRYVITENNKEYVMLSDELDFLKNYVKLQKKRFEDQLFIDFSINGDYSNHTILPSTLIQLTENLFKYGKLNAPSNRAMINITVNDHSLSMVTSNLIVEGENYYSTGTGFKNLKKRLEYAYQEDFIFNYGVKNDIFTTFLKIPLDNKLWP